MDRSTYVALAHHASDLVDAARYPEAIAVFEEILAGELPDFDKGITWVNIATVRDKQGDTAAALDCLDAALAFEHGTGNCFIAQHRAAYLSKLGRHAESAAAYRALLERTDLRDEDAEMFRANLATLERLQRERSTT